MWFVEMHSKEGQNERHAVRDKMFQEKAKEFGIRMGE